MIKTTKTCFACKQELPLSNFYHDRGSYKARCIPCHKQFRYGFDYIQKPKAKKLTDDDVRLIRRLLADAEYHRKQASNLTLEKIAEKFEVSKRMIFMIGKRRSWKMV